MTHPVVNSHRPNYYRKAIQFSSCKIGFVGNRNIRFFKHFFKFFQIRGLVFDFQFKVCRMNLLQKKNTLYIYCYVCAYSKYISDSGFGIFI